MKLTNPQLATITKTISADYPWAGTVEVSILDGVAQVRVLDDADVIGEFLVDAVGRRITGDPETDRAVELLSAEQVIAENPWLATL